MNPLDLAPPSYSPGPFLTVSDSDLLMCSPPLVPLSSLQRTARNPPVLRPRRLQLLSWRARLLSDEFATSTRMPNALLKKRKRSSPTLLHDPTFERAVRCLAADFFNLEEEVSRKRRGSDSEASDDVIFVSATYAQPTKDGICVDHGRQT